MQKYHPIQWTFCIIYKYLYLVDFLIWFEGILWQRLIVTNTFVKWKSLFV
jgi:hypothetical protein